MPVKHSTDLVVQAHSYHGQRAERGKAVCQELNQRVGNWLFLSHHRRERFPLVLLLAGCGVRRDKPAWSSE